MILNSHWNLIRESDQNNFIGNFGCLGWASYDWRKKQKEKVATNLNICFFFVSVFIVNMCLLVHPTQVWETFMFFFVSVFITNMCLLVHPTQVWETSMFFFVSVFIVNICLLVHPTQVWETSMFFFVERSVFLIYKEEWSKQNSWTRFFF